MVKGNFNLISRSIEAAVPEVFERRLDAEPLPPGSDKNR
jgi:hypothetical protein